MSTLPDIEARRRALDPAGSFIVQAPAGSGKTELLTQRYLRLLATVESPEQILAITFTRKAAAEMRARVLHALREAAGPPPEHAHKRSSWELARAVRDADAQRHWRLAEHPARLRIQTIDALNASLARRLPVLAGTGSALEPTDDPRVLYEMATRKLLERLGDGSSVSRQLEVVIKHLANRVDRLSAMMCELLAKRDQWLHPVIQARASSELRATLEETLSRVVRRHLVQLCAALGDARRRELFELLQFSAGNLLAGDTINPARRAQLEQCLARQTPPDEDSTSLDIWRAIVALLFNQKDEVYSAVNVRQGFPTTHRDWKNRMLDVLKQLKTDESLCERLLELRVLPNGSYTDAQWATLQALLDLLPAAVAELQLVFQSQGTADYVEIALRALRALGTADEPTDLALAFDYRVQHILVDEFQDTSFAQLDLLERLTAGWTEGDGRTLFCVGDPMQSIYRFRQAEVGLFIELQERGLRNLRLEPLRLEANFRSSHVLVDWVNAVFPGVLAPRNDAEQAAVRYSPSVAARTDAEGAVTVHAFVNGDAEQEAARVEDIVRDALQKDATGRVAILVTARTHVDAIARRLTTSGVAFRAVEIEQLQERPVVQDLIALTRALVHVADRTAWLAVLRAPWCGLTLPDLHAVAGQSRGVLIEEIERALAATPRDLFDPEALSADGRERLARTYAVLRDAQNERGRWPLRIWVERTWNALGGPATLSRIEDLDDAEAYFDRLEQIETAGDLEDVARLEEQLQRLFASGRKHGDPRVEIMTIHAAKGLEFETVILPGLQRQMRGEDRELLRWTRIAGAGGGMVFAPIKAEGSDSDAIYRWIELLERQRILRERARLLYVAVTRAKRELHLLGTVKASTRDGSNTLLGPGRGSMLQMLWSAVADEFEAAAQSAPAASAPVSAFEQKLRRLPSNWSPPPAPSMLELATVAVVDVTSERPLFDWVTQTSRHVGTLVHRELDRLCRRGLSNVPADLRAARPRLLIELAELGVPPERCEGAYERVVAAIERTLSDERGRWLLGLDGTVSDAASEFPLSGVVEGQIVQGVIDRTFTDAQGVRWVVDFKTSTHEGGGLSAFIDEEVTRYRSQLARYAQLLRMYRPEPVKTALYFPLLGVWREVEV